SDTGVMNTWPVQDSNGLWRINLAVIPVGPSKKAVLSMDYNMWIHESGGENDAIKGSDLWQADFNEVKDAYMNYFNKNYNGSRAPIVIGNHFSNMNDWVYWEAMKSFAEDVCGKPYVQCTTFKEFVNYLNKTGAPPIIK
ncbi:hypothetical protein KW783_04315, partial [Candidatus Parcubacteria bacterium]|nr:hypothetical protein [Candidatus Parcubacteria bacterium]